MIDKTETVPNALTMVGRAEVYEGPMGTYYVVFTPSPGGVDGTKLSFTSSHPVQLGAFDGEQSVFFNP